jgi:hypothetical protein
MTTSTAFEAALMMALLVVAYSLAPVALLLITAAATSILALRRTAVALLTLLAIALLAVALLLVMLLVAATKLLFDFVLDLFEEALLLPGRLIVVGEKTTVGFHGCKSFSN